VYKNLFSEELPVRLSAAVALSRLLDNKTAQDFLRPALRSIFEVYLKTIEEIESEDLVQSLNEFMTVFQNDIAPFTVQIATNLTSQYQRLIKVDFNDDDGESTLAAVGVVSAICNIVSAA